MLDNLPSPSCSSARPENATGYWERALQRAAHAAFMWSEETVNLVTAGSFKKLAMHQQSHFGNIP